MLWCHLKVSHAVHDFCKFSSISEFSSVQGKYRDWAKGANFVSKLPGDIKKQKAAVEEATHVLDHDLREKKLSEQVIPYSDKLFHWAVIEWLVATDQVKEFIFTTNSLVSLSFFLANPSPWTFEVQGDDWHCFSCNKWGEDSRSEGNPGRNHVHVQEPPYNIEILAQCMCSLALLFISHCFNGPTIEAKLAWHVMHGRQATQMATLWSWHTGSRTWPLANGNSRVLWLVSCNSTMHTMVNGLVKLHSRLSNTSELSIR